MAKASYFAEGDSHAETWVHDHARSVLAGHASVVAAAIRRKATRNHLDAAKRKPTDTAAAYLLNKKAYLDYPTALARGWPIATGVIEGACRHLVKDRMDRTGARWSLAGAEAILKLRALRSNGDFPAYWRLWPIPHRAQYARGRIMSLAMTWRTLGLVMAPGPGDPTNIIRAG